jgi:prepilin-type processing-associated H-X9-DG protein
VPGKGLPFSENGGFRHGGFKLNNVVFVDGHVAPTPEKRVPCIGSYPGTTFYLLNNTHFNLGEKKSGGGTINKDL